MTRAAATALLALLSACEPFVPPPEPPQNCAADACDGRTCGLIDDGCGSLVSCDCPAGTSCSAPDGAPGLCAPCGVESCAAGSCGTVVDACGFERDCGVCPQSEACASGRCEPCLGFADCGEERACLGPGACSAIPGCEAPPAPVRDFDGLPPQSDRSADRAPMFEVLPGGEFLWVPLEEAPDEWRWARVPLLAPDRVDPASVAPIPGLPPRPGRPPAVAMALGGAELWECDEPADRPGAATWALFVPDGASGYVERFRTECAGGDPLAPQFFVDGRTAIVAIADGRRLVVTRRSAPEPELVDFSLFEELEPPGIEPDEELSDARTLCDGRLLLVELRIEGSRRKRTLEYEVRMTAPLQLGASREVPLPGVSGLDLSSSAACDRFYQWRSSGLTVWRMDACD